MYMSDNRPKDLEEYGKRLQFCQTLLEQFEPFLGYQIVRIGLKRINSDWDPDEAHGDLVISLQADNRQSMLRIESQAQTPGGVLVEELQTQQDWLTLPSAEAVREQYEREQTTDESGDTKGTPERVLDIGVLPEFSDYIGARLERVSLICNRGYDMFVVGLLLEFNGQRFLHVHMGDNSTELYRSLTRRDDSGPLLLMTIGEETKFLKQPPSAPQ